MSSYGIEDDMLLEGLLNIINNGMNILSRTERSAAYKQLHRIGVLPPALRKIVC